MSAESEAFSAMDAIESGRWDRMLLKLAAAIRVRLDSQEYRATLVAGAEPDEDEDLDTIREGYWHP